MSRTLVLTCVLLLTATAFAALSTASADSAASAGGRAATFSVKAPHWIAGDNWKFHTLQNPNDSTTQGDGLGGTITLVTQFVSDNSTYTMNAGTVSEQGTISWRLTLSGTTHMTGTYDYSNPIFGFAESGCFDGTSTNSGSEYRRATDIAFVGADLQITQTISFYENCDVATPSPLFGTQNSQATGDVTTSVPLPIATFPLTDTSTWNVNTIVTTATTPTNPPGATQTDTITYIYTATVLGMENHTVEAGTFSAVKIHESGTKQKNSDVPKTVDNYLYYAKDAKNRINLTQDGEHLNTFSVTFLPDFGMDASSVAIAPAAMEGRASTITANITNLGDLAGTNVPVAAFVGGSEVGRTTIASLPADATATASISWTPATGSAGTNKNLTVRVDPDAAITEYDDTNNAQSLTITILLPKPDLTIDAGDISVPGTVPTGDLVTISARIHNDGTKDAGTSFVVRFYDSWAASERQIGGDHSVASLALGANTTQAEIWVPGTVGGHTIRVEVDPTGVISEANEANNVASVGVNVVQPDFSFSLSSPAPTQTVDPGKKVDFRVDAANTGKKADTVSFTDAVVPAGWDVALSDASLALTPASTKPLTVSVIPPPGTAAGAKANITVTGTSAGNASYARSIYLEATVNHVAGANVTMLTGPVNQTGRPGETVKYTFEIENLGNDEDTFTLTADSGKGWTPDLGGSTTTGVLAVHGKKKIAVETTIPKDSGAGETDILTLTAKSNFDTTREVTGQVKTTVAQVFVLSIEASPKSVEVDPGRTATITVTLTNDGNGEEDVALNVTVDPEVDWTVDLASSVKVPAGKSKPLTLTMKVPEDGLADDYAVTITAVGGDGEPMVTGVTVSVQQVYKLQLTMPVSAASVLAGKSTEIVVSVLNAGNGKDVVDLTMTGLLPTYTVTVGQPQLTLKPGEAVDVTISVIAPASGKGTYPITVTGKSKDESSASTQGTLTVVPQPGSASQLGVLFLLVVVIAAVGIIAAAFMMRRSRKPPAPTFAPAPVISASPASPPVESPPSGSQPPST